MVLGKMVFFHSAKAASVSVRRVSDIARTKFPFFQGEFLIPKRVLHCKNVSPLIKGACIPHGAGIFV
jgi:hypothetical protein